MLTGGHRAVARAAVLVFAALVAGCDAPPARAPHEPAPAALRLVDQHPVTDDHIGKLTTARWAGDRAIVFTSDDGGVFRIPLGTGQHARELGGYTDRPAATLATDPAGTVVVATADRYPSPGVLLQAWDATGKQLLLKSLPQTVTAVAVDDGGTRVAVAGFDVAVHDIRGHRLVSHGARSGPTGGSAYQDLVFAGEALAGYAPDTGGIDRWDVAAPAAALHRQPCGCDLFTAVPDVDGRYAAVATRDGAVVLWDVTSGAPIARAVVGDPATVIVIPQATLDGRFVLYTFTRLASAPQTGNALYAWDARTGAMTEVWTCPGCYLRHVRRQPATGALLIEAGTYPDDQTLLWTAIPAW